jgi:hypothetical protein
MTYLQRAILAISIALIVLLAALTLRSVAKQADKVPVAGVKPLFNPSSACDVTKEFVIAHPERGMGTEESRAAAEWLASRMKKLHLETKVQQFPGWVRGRLVTGQNVIGIDYGLRENLIVLLAHYDIPYHVREGAMDDASGVGVLLELARVFSMEEQEKTLVFIASDGEEWGMLGARHFVRSYKEPQQIFAAVSLDYLRVEDPEKIYLRGEGQFTGYCPLWLWTLAGDCIRTAGGVERAPLPPMHYLAQAVNISSTDQGPFNKVGIPAINLGGNKSDSPLAQAIYHTQKDTHENMRPELFSTYGKAAEALVRSLDVLDVSPDNESYFLPLRDGTYLGRVPLLVLQFLLFFPLLLATVFQYYNLKKDPLFFSSIPAEAINFVLFIIPWILSILTLYLLVKTNVIPRYELYPATALDPFLFSPAWGALAGVGLAFLIGWTLVFLARRTLPAFSRPAFPASKAVGLDILLSLAIIALLLNGFAATLFLAPAALLWIWMEQGRNPLRVLLNSLLLISSAIPLVLVLVYFSSGLRLGWYFLWYMFLCVAYRFFSPAAAFITIGVLTVGGRLLQQSIFSKQQIVKPETKQDELLESHV